MSEATAEAKQKTNSEEERSDEIVSMRQLLECGVHFGHQTKRWNPRMRKYIFTSRNGIHVIDLQQTIKLIKDTYKVIRDVAQKNGTVLFVGTKKQAQESIESEAIKCEMPYVNHRWLGGTLTNNQTIRMSINKLPNYDRMKEDGTFDQLSKKESSKINKKIARLEYYLSGIRDMKQLPSLLFVVDTKKEQLAIKEATKLGIPIVGVVDTNADPTEVTYPIPANDDAIRAVKLLCSIVSKAILDGRGKAISEAPQAKAENKEGDA